MEAELTNTAVEGAGRLLRVSEVAELRSVHERRLRRAIRRGDLPAFQIGSQWRLQLGDVDAWIERQRYSPVRTDGEL